MTANKEFLTDILEKVLGKQLAVLVHAIHIIASSPCWRGALPNFG